MERREKRDDRKEEIDEWTWKFEGEKAGTMRTEAGGSGCVRDCGDCVGVGIKRGSEGGGCSGNG